MENLERQSFVGFLVICDNGSPRVDVKCPCCKSILAGKKRSSVKKSIIGCDICGYNSNALKKLVGVTVNGYKVTEFICKSVPDKKARYLVEKDGEVLPYPFTPMQMLGLEPHPQYDVPPVNIGE